MEDIFKSKEQEFYIELKQERYFFPGEDISGDVILNLSKSTKITNVKVVLEGTVEIGGRSMSLFSKYVLIAKPVSGDKYEVLEPRTHRFPFTITIPTSKECKVPSTLEIAKLMKIRYQVTAILNKPYSFLEKLNASTTKSINILEDINVDSEKYNGDYTVEEKIKLTGEHRPVTVSTVVGKRAAVKGDTIPISVIIEHIGVMVREKAISVQLLRSVYYGKNKTELFGPKMLREATADIKISGPFQFTERFDLRLAIPTNLCPTVEESAHAFRIEYTLKVSVNLNEESPLRLQSPNDIVSFNLPFTIGTYPKVSFNIDDDDDEEEAAQADPLIEDEISNNSSEYDQVVEKMKEMDLELEAIPPQMIQEIKKDPSPPIMGYTPLPALTPTEPTYIPPPMMLQEVKPTPVKKDILLKPDEATSPSVEGSCQVPMMINSKPPSPVKQSPAITPLERLPSSGSIVSPYATSKTDYATNAGGSSGSPSPIKLSLVPKQPISTPQSPPVSTYQPATTTPPPEHNIVPPATKNNIASSNSYSNYSPTSPATSFIQRIDPTLSPTPSVQHVDPTLSPTPSVQRIDPTLSPSPSVQRIDPTLSPTPSVQRIDPTLSPPSSVHRIDSVSSSHSVNPGVSVERQSSFHWVAPPSTPAPPVSASAAPPINLINKPSPPSGVIPPALPPRPTPSVSNHTNNINYTGGFAAPQPYMNGTSTAPPPQPSFPNNNYNNQHYTYQAPAYNGVNFPQAHVPQYNNSPPPPQYNNNGYNYHQQNNNNFSSFPQPQPQPQPFMGMPSHQNYQSQPDYNYYHH